MMYLLAALATVATAKNFKMEFKSGFYTDDECTDVMDSCDFDCKKIIKEITDQGYEIVKETCEVMECHVKLTAEVKEGDGMLQKCKDDAEDSNVECETTNPGSGAGSGSGDFGYFHEHTKCEEIDDSSAAVLSIAASVVVGLLALF